MWILISVQKRLPNIPLSSTTEASALFPPLLRAFVWRLGRSCSMSRSSSNSSEVDKMALAITTYVTYLFYDVTSSYMLLEYCPPHTNVDHKHVRRRPQMRRQTLSMTKIHYCNQRRCGLSHFPLPKRKTNVLLSTGLSRPTSIGLRLLCFNLFFHFIWCWVKNFGSYRCDQVMPLNGFRCIFGIFN